VYGGRIDIGAFELQPTEYILGDFNRDGIVDSGDYVVWRKQMGTAVEPGSGADANGDGGVDDADHAIWMSNLGSEEQGAGSEELGAASTELVAGGEVQSGVTSAVSPFAWSSAARTQRVDSLRPPTRGGVRGFLPLGDADRTDAALVAWVGARPANDLPLQRPMETRSASSDVAAPSEPSPFELAAAIDHVFETLGKRGLA
jgi:hypothetical protein